MALVAVLALGATACSDDSEPTSDPTSAPTTAPTSEPTTSEPATTEPTTEPTTPTPTPSETATPTPTPTTTPTPEPTPEPDPDAPPTTYDAARARFDATGQEPVEAIRFRTPNGTYCLLDSDFAIGCELPRGGIPDADYCGEGPSQNIGRITFGLDGGGPTAECNSDTIREPGASRIGLDEVAASSATGILCLVEEIGVTCIDPPTSRGFFLGRTSYTVFNAG